MTRHAWFIGAARVLHPMKTNLACFWVSPNAIHLKPGHLKMAFFSARCRAPSMSRRRLPCGIPLERAVRIDVSSANCRAKSHFQVRTSVRNLIFRCPPLRCPEFQATLTAGSHRTRTVSEHFSACVDLSTTGECLNP